jgi:hypothetical protein
MLSGMDAPRSYNWPNVVVITSALVALLVVVASFAAYLRHRSEMTATLMAIFFACFAILKYGVAARALHELRQVKSGGSDPRELYGTPGRFWIWLVMKYVAATLALCASVIIMVHGANHLH